MLYFYFCNLSKIFLSLTLTFFFKEEQSEDILPILLTLVELNEDKSNDCKEEQP